MEGELINTKFFENRKRQGLPAVKATPVVTTEELVEEEHQGHPSTVSSSGVYDECDIPGEKVDTVGDKSRKGSIDTRILPLVTLINSTDDFFTTSTCSGRIILFANETLDEELSGESGPSISKKIKKKGCKWLLVSHDEVQPEEFLKTWRNSCDIVKGNLSFKVEPAILHVQCHRLSDAKKMVHAATESGFRNSGMVIGGKENRVTVAIRSTLGLEVPLNTIQTSSDPFITENYLKFMVEQANDKITENWRRMDKLTDNFQKLIIDPKMN